jgi:hypothetical protein
MSTATFTPAPEAYLGILRPATGHALTVNVRPSSSARVVLLVSDEDRAKVVRHLEGTITVTDLMTGTEHRLKGADCGLGCRCAITFAR